MGGLKDMDPEQREKTLNLAFDNLLAFERMVIRKVKLKDRRMPGKEADAQEEARE